MIDDNIYVYSIYIYVYIIQLAGDCEPGCCAVQEGPLFAKRSDTIYECGRGSQVVLPMGRGVLAGTGCAISCISVIHDSARISGCLVWLIVCRGVSPPSVRSFRPGLEPPLRGLRPGNIPRNSFCSHGTAAFKGRLLGHAEAVDAMLPGCRVTAQLQLWIGDPPSSCTTNPEFLLRRRWDHITKPGPRPAREPPCIAISQTEYVCD